VSTACAPLPAGAHYPYLPPLSVVKKLAAARAARGNENATVHQDRGDGGEGGGRNEVAGKGGGAGGPISEVKEGGGEGGGGKGGGEGGGEKGGGEGGENKGGGEGGGEKGEETGVADAWNEKDGGGERASRPSLSGALDPGGRAGSSPGEGREGARKEGEVRARSLLLFLAVSAILLFLCFSLSLSLYRIHSLFDSLYIHAL